MKLEQTLSHLVAAHSGTLRLWPEARRMCEGETYDHVAQFDDADDADEFTEAVIADGRTIRCNNDFVKGIYTLFFTFSARE